MKDDATTEGRTGRDDGTYLSRTKLLMMIVVAKHHRQKGHAERERDRAAERVHLQHSIQSAVEKYQHRAGGPARDYGHPQPHNECTFERKRDVSDLRERENEVESVVTLATTLYDHEAKSTPHSLSVTRHTSARRGHSSFLSGARSHFRL